MSDPVTSDPVTGNPVTMVSTPIRLDYTFTPGVATSRFLRSVEKRTLVGQRCPRCAKVYVPPRGACSMCGVATEEEVLLPGTGTVTTFAVVSLPDPRLPSPYVTAWIRLDGADITSMFLVQEVDPAQVRLGLRVEPVWVDDAELTTTLENIRYYRPNGEPDAPYEDYREYV